MKILQVNKFMWLSGGAERYMFDLSALLESHGHDVLHFSMADPARNEVSEQSAYFVSNISYKGISPLRAAPHVFKVLGKTVYSFESRRKMRELIRDLKPDIAHLHLIDHHISPSILHALRDENVPVVQSIHDYKLICPNYQLFVPRRGEVCERCLGGNYFNCVAQRCMKRSLTASMLVAGAMYLHKSMRIYEDNVDAFLCSSKFLQEKLEQGGVPSEKLRHVPLYLDLERYRPSETSEDYIVYVGRVVQEKGLNTLISAMEKVPQCRLVIIGEGEARRGLEKSIKKRDIANVEFVGFQTGDALNDLVARARFVVLPSELYETFGLAVWEANALGRPAIGSRIGGIPEAIQEDATGLLFEPGNSDELARKIARLFEDQDVARAMGQAGREIVEAKCATHYRTLMNAYEEALGSH